jgi:hypothetical protein
MTSDQRPIGTAQVESLLPVEKENLARIALGASLTDIDLI